MPQDASITTEKSVSRVMEFLEERLYEHNSAAAGRNDGVLFAKTVRERGRFVAGVAGRTWAEACEITQFWVNDDARGQGLGTGLPQEAENEALGKQCRVVLAKAYSFQAPSFYERHGYRVAQVIEGFPPGHQYYTLTKRLRTFGE